MRYLFLLFIFSPSLCIAESPVAWGIQDLMSGLSKIQETRATFVEFKYLKVLKRPLESSGTLLFKSPGHLEKHTLLPKVESLILDKEMLSIEIQSRNLKRTLLLHDYPEVWALVESIRSTLAGDLNTLQKYYTYELIGDAQHWKLTLHPIEVKARKFVSEIHFSGQVDHVASIETFDDNGDHTLMNISEDIK
jgi:outer membrane lipoprotein-sorting protein